MATFVLIPGMCHGGWSFEPLTEQLRLHGHRVYPLTLTGLSERSHLLNAGANLDTHIQDVVSLLAAERVEDAVLVGHSYGGMVITGAADRVPERVDSLVYLDALVPQHGDSCWTLVSDQERKWYMDVEETGYSVRPLPFFDSRATGHRSPRSCSRSGSPAISRDSGAENMCTRQGGRASRRSPPPTSGCVATRCGRRMH